MRYKLVNFRNEVEHDVEFGTCDMCMHVGDLDFQVYVVENENGERFEFEDGCWSWGSYDRYIYGTIDNVINFAAWFSEQELPSDLGESRFWHEVARYIDEVQGES